MSIDGDQYYTPVSDEVLDRDYVTLVEDGVCVCHYRWRAGNFDVERTRIAAWQALLADRAAIDGFQIDIRWCYPDDVATHPAVWILMRDGTLPPWGSSSLIPVQVEEAAAARPRVEAEWGEQLAAARRRVIPTWPKLPGS